MVIELIASFGMPVGREVFSTAIWIGRFIQAHEPSGPWLGLFRRDVKMHLCNRANARDSNIRQALIDRYGPSKKAAVGTKAAPGPLHTVFKDVWSALALACTAFDFIEAGREAEFSDF